MGPSPISASLGAMVSLPRKLDELLATKHRALRGIVMDEIEQLTAHLRVLHSFMLKLSNAQDPPTSARYWIKDVRELSYDMEDFADQFVQAHGRAKIYFLKRRHHAHGRAKIWRATCRKLISRMKDMCELSYEIEEFIDQFIHALGRAKIRRATCRKLISRLKIGRLPDRRNWRPWITNMISEFRTRAQDATRRYRRYKLDDCVSSPGYSPIGHELPTILQDLGDLVGIEGPMNELERWLINNGEEQLKVVSIVGVGGIGKTTLAQKLWAKLHVQFQCGAFVRTAQKPDMRGILRNILLQVRPHQPPNAGEMRHLINDLREYLQGKRYLIIIDDLWSTSVWDVVSRAFPQSDCCSRIITMTEIMEVALACCCFFPEHIFKMESLGDNDSQKLLLQRILVSGNQSPQQFDDIIPQIVRSCGGLPLAIIIVARILASQPEKLKQWGSAHNYFDSIFGVNPTMEGFMGQILNICFISLPYYLKTCLLYLSTFPEGYLFLKDDLVKQWVAEGFICVNEGEDMEEVARRFFDELVSMGLIQVMDMDCNYEMFSYSVHQLILDLIKYKSIEENFITVVDYSQTTIPLNDKVRRLALHFGSATYATTPTSSRLSQVRSLFFSGLFNCMPSFVVFKLLRVLILHVWDDTGTTELNLTGICELLKLRYLQVTCNVVVKLPDRISAMKHLETLEINTRECDVPSDIVRLPSLLHLRLQGANLPNGIGGIRSLHTLMYFDLGNSSEDSLRGLGELINLQDLHLTYSSSPSSEHLKRNLIALAASVGKLCNLKYLTLAPGGTAAARVILFDGSSDMSMPMFLERLELLPPICILSRLPKWIGQLRKICILKVAVSKLPTTDIAILTGLPSLTVLWLSVQTAPEGRTVFNNYAFPVLKYFKFSCGVLCMSFMAGAMPDLCRLKLVFNTHTGEAYDNMLAGIEHLLKLQDIAVQIGVTTGSDWRAAESAINEAIDKHPRSPGRNFECVDPVAEEFRPSGKHHWSNEKSSLDEKPQDTVVQIGATTGSDWRTAESAINEAIDKHPRSPGRNFECVDPVAEEFRPSGKHHWSNEKSSLDEKPQDTVVQIGATTGSDWRAAESAINEAVDKHPRFPRRNFECVDPAAEEFRPSKKQQKSSLDEKLQDTVVQIGATTGSDWRAAESAINEDIDKHPSFPRRNLQCVDPVVEEFRPSKKHHWSNEKSSLDEQLGVLKKSNDMKKRAGSGPSQLLNLPSTVASGCQESGSSVEESKESPAPSFQVQEKKRMKRSVSFSTVIREAMVMKQVQNVLTVLEPLLRRVVQEETQAGLVRNPRRSSPETPPAAERPAWRLVFLCPPALPIFTGSKIKDVNGKPLQVILVDTNTGSPCGVLPDYMRVELVPLFGDFPPGGREEWTAGEFALGVVKERAGKRPLLTGDVDLTMRDGRAFVNELWFTDNSSWVRCRKFRIGARVVPGSYEGARVAEAMTDAFNVRDHRAELYRKHYPPALGDNVCRLEKIAKNGAFHQKLLQHGVETVQEFLRMLMVKPDMLRAIMGDGMTDRMWEVSTSHAKTCDAGDKVYAYAGQHGATVYVNSICQLVKIEFAGVECAAQQLSRPQKAYVHQLYMEAFEQRENLQEAEPATMLLHAGSSSSSSSSSRLPMLHNAIVGINQEGDPIEEDATAVGINQDETSTINV